MAIRHHIKRVGEISHAHRKIAAKVLLTVVIAATVYIETCVPSLAQYKMHTLLGLCANMLWLWDNDL